MAAGLRDGVLLALVVAQAVAIAVLLGRRQPAEQPEAPAPGAPATAAAAATPVTELPDAPAAVDLAPPSPAPDPAGTASPVDALVRELTGMDILEPDVRAAVFRALREQDATLACRLVATLRDTRDPAVLEFLRGALGWGKIHADALPTLIAVARAHADADRRLIAIDTLGEATRDQRAFDTLCEISAARAEADSMRVAAIESLLSVQQFPYRGGEDRMPAHLAHLKTIIASDAPEAVRAAATGQLFGVETPDDVRYVVALAREDRSPEVRIAAMSAFPIHWGGGDEETDKCYGTLAAISGDDAQPPTVRLAALLAGGGFGLADEQQALARRLIADGATGTCPGCRERLPGKAEGCDVCKPLRGR